MATAIVNSLGFGHRSVWLTIIICILCHCMFYNVHYLHKLRMFSND